jgi:hypothetical protein
MKQLNSSEVKRLVDKILSLIPIIQQKRFKLFGGGKLAPEDFLAIARYERRLLDFVDDLSLIVFQEIMTDLQEPGKKLQKSTEAAQAAIGRIEETLRLLNILKSFVNLIGAVVLAVKLGTPATLIGLSNELDKLLRDL